MIESRGRDNNKKLNVNGLAKVIYHTVENNEKTDQSKANPESINQELNETSKSNEDKLDALMDLMIQQGQNM